MLDSRGYVDVSSFYVLQFHAKKKNITGTLRNFSGL